nr:MULTISPECIES: PEP-utilizing enzyme [unclassified Methanosarcina]
MINKIKKLYILRSLGGMVTHSTVIAQEYGISSVVSIENVTRILKEGQYVRVDGTRALYRFWSEMFTV